MKSTVVAVWLKQLNLFKNSATKIFGVDIQANENKEQQKTI